MNFGYANSNARAAALTQIAALRAFDPKIKIWTEGKGSSEDFDHIVDRKKVGVALGRGKGHAVVVVEFHMLATSRDELTRRVRDIHKIGAVIIEASTRRSTEDRGDLAEMMLEAAEFYRVGGMSAVERRRVSKLGGAVSAKASKAKALERRMPISEAVRYLNDPALSVKEALALIAKDRRYKVEWSMSYYYKRKREAKQARENTFIDKPAGRRANET